MTLKTYFNKVPWRKYWRLLLFITLFIAHGLCAYAGAVPYEAEKASLSYGAKITADHHGFSGKGFVGGFYNNSQAQAKFQIKAEKSGKQFISLRYAAGHGNASVKLHINGKEQVITCPSTTSWKVWAFIPVKVDLKQGVNEVAVSMARKTTDCINLDYVTLGKFDFKLPANDLSSEETAKRLDLLKKANLDQLVVIVRNFIHCSHNYTYFNEGFRAGGGLYLFSKGGFKQLVNASTGQILDAELSYNGKTILFSWKKNGRTNYDIYTINVDGSNLKQLTRHPGNDFNASWLPDGGITFLSDRDNNYAYCMHSSSAVLYRMEADTSKLRRLSANYLSDIAPHVMGNGKIMFCRWEYVDRFQIPCQGLWAQNPDGTGLVHIYGGRMLTPVTISEAKSVPGSNKIIATLTGHNGSICGGIGIIDPKVGANNPKAVTTILGEMVTMARQGGRNKNQKYEFPYPVNKQYFLVSNDGSIELSTYDGKEVSTILNKNDGPAIGRLGFYAALPVQTRKREPVIPSSLPPATNEDTSTVIMQDVYMGLEEQLADGTLKRGDVKQIRVVEALGKSNKGSQSQRAFCWQFPVVSAGATMEPKKTVSIVNVEKDGSAMFEVPAMKPVIFQALDAEGRVIQRMRTFTQFMPGEVQSCTGCHMDRNTAVPANRGSRVLALKKPVQKINGSPWKEHPTAFSYPQQVQPIWDKHCVSCHNAKQQPGNIDLSGDLTDLFNVSYDNLVRDGANRNPAQTRASSRNFPHKYVSYIPSYNGAEAKYMHIDYFKPKSWGSYKSRLAEIINNGHPNAKGEKRVALSDMEKRIVYTWIDYNVPYYQTSHTNHPDLPHGMRELVPKNFDNTLMDIAKRRCIDCHNKPANAPGWWQWNWNKGNRKRHLPRKFYLRWEKPELNNFMLAPLAKESGGTGKCGREIFKDKNDPDYQKLLRAFDSIHKKVKEVPRMDMPSAKEERCSNHSILYDNIEQP